ncbi:SDR family NAD(P)-dependent oxidoreductase [Paenibacillus mendelii]|uniref:SDR family NAD(P)-dependent oxidoreductase n=1 Tax=Paenibacillus mendelii TaxID=206163 RepID=A0ABV6J5I2_9BACL|nr:SDR family NAD(P)-dependent oxidoreductase [Paenibacillus mendelii]MCQ6560241.1 SDR family oxidoreductase [Paenibacillus mendelii]
MSVQGKAAIITGSTSGIGQAAAETLARHGAKVLVSGRDQTRGESIARCIMDSGGEAHFIPADLSDPQAPGRLVHETVRLWGRIDIVVNNAALVCNKPVEKIVHEDWDRLLFVNLKAPFFLIQAALPYLKESRGSVINISSINGIRNDRNNLIYDTIKAGLNHMTQGLALDLRSAGIRCNVLMPGGIATPLLNQWFRQFAGNPEEADRLAEAAKQEPNVGTPQQIADAVLFLAGSQAAWVNGAVVPIDGGYHL